MDRLEPTGLKPVAKLIHSSPWAWAEMGWAEPGFGPQRILNYKIQIFKTAEIVLLRSVVLSVIN